jgi:phosphatidyl-myo-inositol dimannoside synthase
VTAATERPSILLLAPSAGLGGGIERYLESIEASLRELGYGIDRVNARSKMKGSLPSKVKFVVLSMAQAGRRPDVILAMHPNFFGLARVLSRMTGRPWYGWAYGSEVFDRGDARRAVRAARSARRLVTISEYTRTALVEGGADAADVGIVTPVLDQQWWDRVDAVHVRKSEQPQIVAVSRLTAEAVPKGVDILIEVIERLRSTIADVRLVVVGDGVLRARFEDEVRSRSLSEHVRFAGRLDDDELVKVLAESWVFALPSRVDAHAIAGEGFGIVYIEAASLGLPVVGSTDGGAAEAVLDATTGYAVDPRDVTAVCDAIQRLLNDADHRRSMGEAGASWTRSVFTTSRMAAALNTILHP